MHWVRHYSRDALYTALNCAGKQSEALYLLEQLAENAINESRLSMFVNQSNVKWTLFEFIPDLVMQAIITGCSLRITWKLWLRNLKVMNLTAVIMFIAPMSMHVFKYRYLLYSITDPSGSSLVIEKRIAKFQKSMNLAELYYVYHCIHCFVEQPFTSYLPEALHNMARFLMLKTNKICPRGISRVYPSMMVLFFLTLI